METSLGHRIRALRKARGMSQQELGNLLGWGNTRLSMYERDQRTPKINQLKQLADIFQCSIEQFVLSNHDVNNAKYQPSINKSVPLVSWERVLNVGSNEETGEWVAPLSTQPSSKAFALRIEGDSMTAPSGASFPEGCIIIVDPERSAKPGDYVVAKDTATNRATFKRLMTDGSRWFLKPLNPAYPAIEVEQPQVIGVAVEWQVSGKL